MTIEQHLLIQIYATQKVYLTRMLEMVCAMQETLETKEEPTGLLFAAADHDIKEVITELIKQLKESQPTNSPFLRDHIINDDVLQTWVDTATDAIMNYDNENEEEGE